jgi:uncharacterized protein (TIGR00369 family)
MYDTALPNKLDFEAMAAMLRRAPFHQWLGLELEALNPGDVVIRMPWREEIVSSVTQGYAHGGVLATLIDLTCVFALVAKAGRGGATLDMRVDYHRPAIRTDLRCIGRVIRLGRTVATAEANVLGADGRLLASGRAACMAPQD